MLLLLLLLFADTFVVVVDLEDDAMVAVDRVMDVLVTVDRISERRESSKGNPVAVFVERVKYRLIQTRGARRIYGYPLLFLLLEQNRIIADLFVSTVDDKNEPRCHDLCLRNLCSRSHL